MASIKECESKKSSYSPNNSVGLSMVLNGFVRRKSDKESFQWWLCFWIIALIAIFTRFYKISEPNHVCWDETHFGKMASWYINKTFFFDVHPPLGKMLIALSGYWTGYNGTFAFNKPGDSYEDYPILGMRIFCATLGTLIVPSSFVIVWNLSHSLSASILSSTLILFDIGMIILSQYILLDPILMFFIFSSTMGMTMFQSYRNRAFETVWWFWLLWTGFSLACSISVKFVGLFVVLLIGFNTIYDLWNIYGDLEKPISLVLKHFIARAFGLIVLPIIIYIGFFWVHLSVLSRTGSGDGFYSSAFQSTLEGNSLYNASMPQFVAYGSVITIKNHRTGGAYLHSHWHLYPEGVGARQQQVTTYSHKDDNNKWRIKKYNEESSEKTDPIEIVKNGDLIRLEHVVTERNLHSHNEIAPMTKKHYQATCYGEKGVGDANDVFRIEFESSSPDHKLEAVKTRFKLIHYLMNCALYSHNKQLPKWAFEQLEVTCSPNVFDNKNTMWNVEDNSFARLPNVSVNVYAPTFWEKFLESHAVMLQGNSGLKPKEGEITSRPWQWPINYKGQFFSGNDYKIYLLGNPIVWWLNLLMLFFYLIIISIILIRKQRGCTEISYIEKENERFVSASFWLFFGWSLHYFPFYAMGRVLYFHHYFPAAIFSSMLTAVILDYLFKTIPVLMLHIVYRKCSPETIEQRFQSAKMLLHFVYGTFLAAIVYSFYLFSPLAYGIIRLMTSTAIGNDSTDGIKSVGSSTSLSNTDAGQNNLAENQIDYSSEQQMKSLRWMDSWEF
ncbi:Protein O-mannosyl-transferase 2 [Sarcoptes scabiei]|uniref:Protein O-mannosyl-transferase 2 n=1 Tax=Sarcoptes scabiei TaxID=52283 RepID=A0A834VFA6_SARSC|nr:Protein O-mannosyl-transferase 2 [Sarcoptes scabiei]